MTLTDRYAAIVCDLDGVVYRGPHAVPHAVAALAGAGLPVQYATNNASRPPARVAEHLTGLGLLTREEDVATSSQAGAWVLRDHVSPGAAVLAIGGVGVAVALREAGFEVEAPTAGRDAVAAVLQGYGPDVSAAELAEAAYAIEDGAVWVATNTDATLPTERGVAPGNGALVGAVERAVGRAPDAVAGKPYQPLYLLCADRLGLAPQRLLAVGDRLETDIEGAVSAGMDSVLVLTGVHDLRTAALAAPERRPTYLLPDLRGLSADLDPPRREDGWGACGPRRRRVTEAGWEESGDGSALTDLNAVLQAVYAAFDTGALAPERLDEVWDVPQAVLAGLTDR
jgi:HAD superfamily hydrolase (TIGR01450 family)